ncbi:hypothetical protein HLB44_04725 [Aquincola sp. S2]|uniref:Uncharacterized protein n=1 Tax=Pseudaquabacterium terrae TaxID=2732868 RepID=A0ABX2ECG2_9BURK|nr:hypothetical protein [Aquabacterium terrae]NRF66281.1 hypothetical protein [Aquabacterium terrae]
MRQRHLAAAALLGLASTCATGQAVFDTATQQLTVPTIDVGGQLYRNLVVRLDADGRLTIISLQPPVDDATRFAAATTAANSASNACAAIRPFYWEVGDKVQRQAGGSVRAAGNATVYEAGTVMNIASASKWLYGAYVAEQRGGALTAEDITFLNFTSGYVNFPVNGCEPGDTVASCVARGSNGQQTPAEIGRFHYNGGHMQKHASLASPGMNLGALNNATLAAEMRRVLGTDISFSFTQPQLPGGARTTARDYATFLRKLLNRQLKLGSMLGHHPVCTNPATCPSATSAPVPAQMSWHYAIGHWVEDDPATGDGAFSSAGAFGFYPWIDAARSHYGVIARVALFGNGAESAACGAAIRRAFISGVVP